VEKITGNVSKGFIKQQGPRMFLMEVENVPCASERPSISLSLCPYLPQTPQDPKIVIYNIQKSNHPLRYSIMGG